MRRKTIARNPLDELGAPKRKGRKAAPTEVRTEIRAAILNKSANGRRTPAKDGSVSGWLKSVWSSLTD